MQRYPDKNQGLRHVFMMGGGSDMTVDNLIQTATTCKSYTYIPSAMFNEFMINSLTLHPFLPYL